MVRYIYKITVNGTKLYYIGQRTAPCDSPELDINYMGSGNALRAYSLDKLTKVILSVHDTQEELDQAEKDAIGDKWATDKNCLNQRAGGGGASSKIVTLESLPETWESIIVNGELFIKVPVSVSFDSPLRGPTIKKFIYQVYLNDGGEEDSKLNLVGRQRLPSHIEQGCIYTKRGRYGFSAVKPALLKMMLLQLGPEIQVALLTGAYEIKTVVVV